MFYKSVIDTSKPSKVTSRLILILIRPGLSSLSASGCRMEMTNIDEKQIM